MATDIFVGSVAVGVVPDARGWDTELQRQLVPSSDAVGKQVGQNISRGIVQGMADKEPDVAKKGEESGGAFGDAFSKRLKASLDALPKAKLDADASPAEKKVDELRQRMDDLSHKEIGVDMTSKEAMAELDKINVELDKVKFKAGDIELKFNTAEARAQLDLLSRDISDKTGASSGPGGVLGLLNKIPGINLGGAGSAAGGLGAQGGQGAAQAASAGGGLLSNPYVLAGGGAAALAAAPFLGQAIGGVGVAGLGAGLAGLGIAGTLGIGTSSAADIATQQQAVASAQAAQGTAQANLNKLRQSGTATTAQLVAAEVALTGAHQKVQDAQKTLANMTPMTAGQEKVKQGFADLQQSAEQSLTKIGVAFVPVMESIEKTAGNVIGRMTPVFAGAMKIISGPVERFADTILNAFARPAVQKSINDIANAFGKILDAFTPDIPGIADSLAQAISRMADAIAKNPKAFADFLNFMFQIVIAVIDAIAYLTDFADYIEQHFMPAIQHFVNFWKDVWRDIEGAVRLAISPILDLINFFLNSVRKYFEANRATLLAAWHGVWDVLVIVARYSSGMITAMAKLMWDILRATFTLGAAIVKAVWQTLWDSLKLIVTLEWNFIRLFIKLGWDIIVGIFTVSLNLLTGHWGAAWNNIKDVGVQIWNALKQFFEATFNAIDQFWSDRLDNMKNVASAGWTFIKSIWDSSLTYLKNAISAAVTAITQTWSKIQDALATPIKWVAHNVLAHLFNAIDDITNFVGLKKPLQGAADSMARLATGGRITQGTHGLADDVPIWVSRGETVVSAAHSRLPFMQAAFTAAGVPGYPRGATGFPPHVQGMGNPGIDWRPKIGMAAGGDVEKAMLDFMLSKRGSPYSEGNRWGRPPWDCSSLVWDAGHAAGLPWPQSVAIANTEAEWLAGYPGTYMYQNASEIQTGDILFQSGASPDPSPWGGIGHTGMAASPSAMISALGTAYGVTLSGIGNITVGARLGGKGGKGLLSKIGSFIGGVFGSVVRSVEDILSGIGKYAKVAVDLAKGNVGGALAQLMGGVGKGTGGAGGVLEQVLAGMPTDLAKKALSFLVGKVKSFVSSQQSASATGGGSPDANIGSGVTRWSSLALQALQMNNEPSSLLGQVLRQMQTESGGNPNAINNWDVNAQHGDPSRGLLQVIGSTFAAYHVPGTSNNIYDPLANIAAAINYAKHTYGPSLMRGGMGMGSGHGYDDGGWLPPGATMAFNGTGRPELVLTADQLSHALSGQGGGYHAHFDGLTMQTIESHVRSAFSAMQLQQGNVERQGRRR